jgi:hypothetical protein
MGGTLDPVPLSVRGRQALNVLCCAVRCLACPFADIDKQAGLDVIATCGQDPCEPTLQGMLAPLIAGLFTGSVLIVLCVCMMYGRGKLAFLVN